MNNKEEMKFFREKQGMTQKELAEWLKIDLRTVQNWESRGTSETTMKLIYKIDSLVSENKRLKKIIKEQQLTFDLNTK